MSYTHSVAVSLSYEDAVTRTRAALAEHGFGVLSEIDVRAIFDKKLGTDAAEAVGDYVILGACNPTPGQVKPWPRNRSWGLCCRATLLSGGVQGMTGLPSRRSTRRPW